ncbi:MAG: lysophospholipid acyltransferase family protein, partial [Candidatus Acidiferrales bacterium]
VLGVATLLVAPWDHQQRLLGGIGRLWARLILATSFIRVEARGRENLEPGKHYVIVANHASYIDIPALLVHLPAEARFMAKRSLFHIPFFGWYLQLTGHLPVRRGGGYGNARQLLQAMRYIRQGRSLVVFPEGGRSHTGRLEAFKAGMFRAAVKAGAPILPVTIVGSGRLLPRFRWHLRPGRIEIIINPPVETQALKREDIERLVAEVRGTMERNLAEAGQ